MNARRTAIVTGAGSGIGRAIAQRLAEDGHAVAILDLDAAAAEAIVGELRQKGHEAMAPGRVVRVLHAARALRKVAVGK